MTTTKELYEEGSSGKCPHCGKIVYFDDPTAVYGQGRWSSTSLLTQGGGDRVYIYSSECPSCKKPIVTAKITSSEKTKYSLVHPLNIVRTVPPDVPKEIGEDFLEAAAVLPISEKASAALSRRCLQNLLTDRGYKEKDLHDQIERAIKDLPTRIAENLDVIRNIGNYAAHPMKVESSSTIVDVEPEEASWTLDVLEELFDYYYVMPKRAEDKRKKLDEKLKAIGKPKMKKP